MSRRTRLRALALAAVTGAAMVVTGCSSTIPGTPHASECVRHDLDLAHCAEYRPMRPVAEDIMVGSDRPAAARQLCTLLPEHRLRELAGGEVFRTIDPTGSGACLISAVTESGQPRFSFSISAFPEAMQGYAIPDVTERTDIAGHPAWRTVFTDALGNRSTDYTIATGKSATSGGVVFVKVRAELPRGVLEMAEPPDMPAYQRRAEIAETVITALEKL